MYFGYGPMAGVGVLVWASSNAQRDSDFEFHVQTEQTQPAANTNNTNTQRKLFFSCSLLLVFCSSRVFFIGLPHEISPGYLSLLLDLGATIFRRRLVPLPPLSL